MSKRTLPAYRLYKRTGQAVVTLTDAHTGRRQDVYLGEYDTPASRQAYARVIADWEAAGRVLDAPQRQAQRSARPAEASESVSAVALGYLRYCKSRYPSLDPMPSRITNIQQAMRVLRSHYGGLPAAEFGPLALQNVRAAMVERGWVRNTVNERIRTIQAAFQWAVGQQIVRAEVHHALTCVASLRRGEAGVQEGERVTPVPEPDIAAVRPHVSDQVWTLIQLQLLTGARAGELVTMRLVDLDTEGRVWLYRPADHKTAHHGHDRTIYVGPQAQQHIQRYMAGRALDAYLLSPREAEIQRRLEQRESRTAHPSTNKARDQHRRENPRDRAGNRYTTSTYRRAVERGCKAAGVNAWTPHRLRHNAATHIRKEFGIEAARLILGHRTMDATSIYAEEDKGKAMDIIARVG